MSSTIAWICLIIAGGLEVVWAYFLKQSDGLTKLTPAICFLVTISLSTVFLALSIKELPISVAYPVWTGIGAVGTVLIGIMVFGETLTLLNGLFLMMIIIGVIGIKFLS